LDFGRSDIWTSFAVLQSGSGDILAVTPNQSIRNF